MKGIVLAGGAGTRLWPATRALSKQLLPVYDKPMIYYPISTLMSGGIREMLIITTPRDLCLFQDLLGDGAAWGVSFEYAVQDQPRGIADAFRVGEKFVSAERTALVLGDNLFLGQGLAGRIRAATASVEHATVFAYRVSDPQRYGVIEFDDSGAAVSIEEKPIAPKSDWAVTGLYIYRSDVVDIVAGLQPSERNELEITAVNQVYLDRSQLQVERLGRGVAWLDAGTHDSLLEAADLVQAVEHRQGVKLACPEEMALAWGWIDLEQVARLGRNMGGSTYAQYLSKIARTGGTPLELL